jgi:hypothetical protein
MKLYSIEQVLNPRESAIGVFKRDAPDKTVNFITTLKQEFGEITAILSGNSCY